MISNLIFHSNSRRRKIYLKLTQIQGKGTIQSFEEQEVSALSKTGVSHPPYFDTKSAKQLRVKNTNRYLRSG